MVQHALRFRNSGRTYANILEMRVASAISQSQEVLKLHRTSVLRLWCFWLQSRSAQSGHSSFESERQYCPAKPPLGRSASKVRFAGQSSLVQARLLLTQHSFAFAAWPIEVSFNYRRTGHWIPLWAQLPRRIFIWQPLCGLRTCGQAT